MFTAGGGDGPGGRGEETEESRGGTEMSDEETSRHRRPSPGAYKQRYVSFQ